MMKEYKGDFVAIGLDCKGAKQNFLDTSTNVARMTSFHIEPSMDKKKNFFRRKVDSLTTFLEENRQNIFYLFIFYVITIALFVERFIRKFKLLYIKIVQWKHVWSGYRWLSYHRKLYGRQEYLHVVFILNWCRIFFQIFQLWIFIFGISKLTTTNYKVVELWWPLLDEIPYWIVIQQKHIICTKWKKTYVPWWRFANTLPY